MEGDDDVRILQSVGIGCDTLGRGWGMGSAVLGRYLRGTRPVTARAADGAP